MGTHRLQLSTCDEFEGAVSVLREVFRLFPAFKTHVHLDLGGAHKDCVLYEILKIDDFFSVKRLTVYRRIELSRWEDIFHTFRNVKEIVLGNRCTNEELTLILDHVKSEGKEWFVRKAPSRYNQEQVQQFYEINLFLDV
uniref:FTH domain-containing protein n=1 Tax=Caenorhabditis tropicalis TaxID=1561998 RepID=A0A1I7TLT7_9PELO